MAARIEAIRKDVSVAGGALIRQRRGRLTVPHHRDQLPIPIEIRSNVSAAMTASPANKSQFNVGQPDIIQATGHR
jgi:hypothetical protein